MNFFNRKVTKKNSFYSKPCLEGLEIRLVPAGEFLLHSNPGATKSIFLDFDGHTTRGTAWLNGKTIVTPPYSIDNSPYFSVTELENIRQIWARVSEDFLPFNVDVTTQDPGIEGLRRVGRSDTAWGVRVAIGQNDAPAPGAGGSSYVGVYGNEYYGPAFVFPGSLGNDPKNIAEGVSHEVGHNLGLNHDGDASREYYRGHGSGVTGWAPIMGNGVTQNLTQWSNGIYPGANNREDDIGIIGSSANGFGYRADDFGNTIATASNLNFTNSTTISTTGIIGVNERNIPGRVTVRGSDLDFFRFNLAVESAVTISINPAVYGPNLDIQAKLYKASDTSYTHLLTSNPTAALNASFSTTLAAGTYYISVDGIGMGNPVPIFTSAPFSGYTSYGSLGLYSITGTVVGISTPPPVNTGAKITTASATGLDAGSSTGFRIKFDKPIQPSTFTAADITLTNPTGWPITVTNITAVPNTNNTEFTFSITTLQTAGIYTLTAGIYTLKVGPNILDLSGNQMNQDNDGLNGGIQDHYVGSFSLFTSLPAAAPGWKMVGTGDFNGDGTTDILWRRSNDTGEARIWLIRNGHLTADIGLPNPAQGWKVVGTGDFNGDGTTDILWRRSNDTGEARIWLIRNGRLAADIGLPNPAQGWKVVGTRDVDGDGTTDILWKRSNNTGEVRAWIIRNGRLAADIVPLDLSRWANTASTTSTSTSSPAALPNNPTSPANSLVPNASSSSNTSSSSSQRPTTQQTVVDQLFSGLFRI